jgi:hypothetical protein
MAGADGLPFIGTCLSLPMEMPQHSPGAGDLGC